MTVVIRKPILEKKVKVVSLKSYWLMLDELRLNAIYYAQDVAIAKRLLNESGYSLVPLETLLKNVFYPPRSKRYLTNKDHGVPYLTASEYRYLQPRPKFIIASKIPKIENWYVREGWILLSRSGTVGIPMLATKRFENYIFSEHLIRVVPELDTLIGFIHAYMSSWIGQALITKDRFGAVVEEIEPHHVESLPVPKLPKEIQKEIHHNILKAFKLRDNARFLLDKAQEILLKELVVPQIEEKHKVRAFHVKVSDLKLRFDASFHDEEVKKLQMRLRRGKYPTERIGEEIGEVFIAPRFKRIYVEKEYGIPFLSGTNIAQIKPYDPKYLSRKATKNLEKWIVHANWILVTCSGTIGRVTLTPKEWDGWAITQHVLRIIPNLKKVHPGYLTAFLMSSYGYNQVVAKIYGGVVDELAEEDIKNVLVSMPSMNTQEKIGSLVVEAFELKELANKIEEDTIHTLEDMLTKHRKIEDAIEYFKEIEGYAETFDLIGDEKFRESLEQAEKGDVVPFEGSKKEQ